VLEVAEERQTQMERGELKGLGVGIMKDQKPASQRDD
jgi:hypothetical protein